MKHDPRLGAMRALIFRQLSFFEYAGLSAKSHKYLLHEIFERTGLKNKLDFLSFFRVYLAKVWYAKT